MLEVLELLGKQAEVLVQDVAVLAGEHDRQLMLCEKVCSWHLAVGMTLGSCASEHAWYCTAPSPPGG